MPTFNRGRQLKQSIEGILQQSLKDFELLVVDDGSFDNTVSIVGHYEDQRMRYVKIQHGGPAVARNRGLSLARGAYIAYCDDDSVLHKGHLQMLVDFLNKNAGVAMVYSDGILRFPSGDACVFNLDFDKRRLETRCFFMTCNVVHRRSCFQTVGGFDEKLFAKSDWDLWLRISDTYAVSHISQITGQHTFSIGGETITGYRYQGRCVERLVKKRLTKMKKGNRLASYSGECAFGVVRHLVGSGNIRYAIRLADTLWGAARNYQTAAAKGFCALVQHNLRGAILFFEKSRACFSDTGKRPDPWQKNTYYDITAQLAKAYYLSKKESIADGLCRDVLRKEPGHFLIRVVIAEQFIRRRLTRKALGMLVQKQYGEWENNAQFYNLKGCCYLRLEQLRLAEGAFQDAISLSPHIASYHYNLAAVYRAQRRYGKAQREHQIAVDKERYYLKDAVA
jgi:glycosyltransferase involved in cell wall biosynthesis